MKRVYVVSGEDVKGGMQDPKKILETYKIPHTFDPIRQEWYVELPNHDDAAPAPIRGYVTFASIREEICLPVPRRTGRYKHVRKGTLMAEGILELKDRERQTYLLRLGGDPEAVNALYLEIRTGTNLPYEDWEAQQKLEEIPTS